MVTAKKARKVTRQAQYGATCVEAELSAERRHKYYGCVKVALERLDFTQSSARPLDRSNVARLISSFELGGCLRHDACYHVPAVMDDGLLRRSVLDAGASMNDLRSHDPSVWPRLALPVGVQVQCLHGQHRIAAARQYLLGRDRWWVIDIYSATISHDLRRSLAEQTANEVPLSAGQIYFHMLRCAPEDSEAIDAWRAQLQSDHESQKVPELFNRTRLSAAFREVAKIPALGAFMLAGNIDALLGAKCDEEIIHYLTSIPAAWSFFTGGEAMLHRIDRSTIEELQLRCPANCARDQATLKPKVDEGTIFAAFDVRERQEIWQNLLVYHRRIPSLWTFFEDLKYLRDLARSMKQLVKPSRRQTIRQAFRAACDLSPDRFDRAYRRLWIFLMRELKSLQPQSGRMERKELRELAGKNLHVEHAAAQEARDFGFQSAQIDDLLRNHPDHKVAREVLLRARRPSEYVYPDAVMESCLTDMVAIFNRAQAREPECRAPPVLVVTGDGEYRDDRRCGRPHTLATQHTDRDLTFENFHVQDSRDVGGLSAFYVRRDVYLSFFGALEDEPGMDSTRSTSVAGGDQVFADVTDIVDAIDRELGGPLLDRAELRSATSSPTTERGPGMSAPTIHDAVETESAYTDEVVPPEIEDGNEGEPEVTPETVRFIGPRGELLVQVVMEHPNDPAVEAVASRFYHRALLLYDAHSRSVHPSHCLNAAREHEHGEIIVRPRQLIGHKRRIDDISSATPDSSGSWEPPRPLKRANRQTGRGSPLL